MLGNRYEFPTKTTETTKMKRPKRNHRKDQKLAWKKGKNSHWQWNDCPVVSGSYIHLVLIIVYSWSTFRENVVVSRLPSAWVGFWNKVTQYNFLKCERISDVKCTFSSEFHRPFFSIVVVVCFSRYGRFVSIVSFWSFRLFRCGRFGRYGSFACFVSVVSFRCFGF